MRKAKWIKKRHAFIRNIVFTFLYPYTVLKFGVNIKKFKGSRKTTYLILYNHQTVFDQFFVGMSVKGPIYYLATEDIFSNGWVSSLIRFLVAPIPIKKQTLDVNAVKTCLRVAKEGGTLAIAPEGNRTYSGKTEYINPAIASLAKKLGLPILLYRIEGGYGVQPRWSDVIRRGKMQAGVSEIITPDEIEGMSKEELFQRISKGLSVDEATPDNRYLHKNRAEFLERAIYVCPYCGLSSFRSNKDVFECSKCKRQFLYNPTTELQGKGFKAPFSFISEWCDYQKSFVNGLDVMQYVDNPMYTEQADVYEVVVYKNKRRIIENAQLSLFGDRIVITDQKGQSEIFMFSFVSAVTVLGRNKLNIYSGGRVYQIKGGKRFNALKYVHIFNRYKNICKGEKSGEFLGL